MSDVLELLDRAHHVNKIASLLPLNDRVLLKRLKQEDAKQIKIADAYQPDSNLGEVLGIGKYAVGELKIGDHVLFSHFGAQDIEIDGEKLVLITIHDIWLRL